MKFNSNLPSSFKGEALLKLLTYNLHVNFSKGHQITLTSRIKIGVEFECVIVSKSTKGTKNALFQLFPFKSRCGRN